MAGAGEGPAYISGWASTPSPGFPTGLYERIEPRRGAASEARSSLLADDPVDAIWDDQPGKPIGRIYPMPVERAGEEFSKQACTLSPSGCVKHERDLLVETQAPTTSRGCSMCAAPMSPS